MTLCPLSVYVFCSVCVGERGRRSGSCKGVLAQINGDTDSSEHPLKCATINANNNGRYNSSNRATEDNALFSTCCHSRDDQL